MVELGLSRFPNKEFDVLVVRHHDQKVSRWVGRAWWPEDEEQFAMAFKVRAVRIDPRSQILQMRHRRHTTEMHVASGI
ncbi:hypothetical protein [Austwickia chelonae]|uniref:Uncharacterized protein n=1 Tax=Austwickia chelonae NBRC 105200 TaxID=1184607 RepID=K6VN91_9MICO|nr:hypothetical protein [Austwickia chelonae]GAB78189.1 hypothetical protein AUCHE_08_04340 [Austwickia chelonae NBRC 105200]